MGIEQNASKKVNFEPTKSLFIYMITKDISFETAILDLIDNPIDALKRDGLLEGEVRDYFIDVNLKGDVFIIEDNCNGIPIENAVKYAFRFGRPREANTESANSNGVVGQFGIGMKRSIFKIGRNIIIESQTSKEYFKLHIDVDKWEMDENNWEVSFEEAIVYPEGATDRKMERNGTKIYIDSLYYEASIKFGNDYFINGIRESTRSAQEVAITKGINILINSQALYKEESQIKLSEEITPANFEKEYSTKNGTVYARFFAGIQNTKGKESGWTVYCNGRAVLQHDKTELTGWGEDNGNPSYHSQYSLFHGFLFLDSRNVAALPLNTTKTGIDHATLLWESVKLDLIQAMKPIITFLNARKEEYANEEDSGEINISIDSAPSVPLSGLPKSSGFSYSKPIPRQKKQKNISYKIDQEIYEKAIEYTEAKNSRELGLMTFNYFMEMEVGE